MENNIGQGMKTAGTYLLRAIGVIVFLVVAVVIGVIIGLVMWAAGSREIIEGRWKDAIIW